MIENKLNLISNGHGKSDFERFLSWLTIALNGEN